MISYLKGKVLNQADNYLIIEIGQIGYKVFYHSSNKAEIKPGQDIALYTHQYVREDSLDLYGFNSLEELEMFEGLLSISGIGPKSAQGVLTVASVADITASIVRGDPSLLTKVSGIGRKTAERVVLELREKILKRTDNRRQMTGGNGSITASGEEIDALMALGYSLGQAREALQQVGASVKDSGERIKAALKGLGR